MEKECKFCGKIIIYEKPQQLGGHLTNCSANPNKIKKIIKAGNSNKARKREYILKCKKCGKEYSLLMTEKHFIKGNYKKNCSLSCASRRLKTEESKLKTSLSVKNNEHLKLIANLKKEKWIKGICLICGDEFSLPKWKMKYKKYCSSCNKKENGKWSDSTKKLFSQNMKKRFEENPELHPNRLCAGIKESYPEKSLREYFELKGLIKEKDFKQQFKVDKFFLDFYIPKLNLGIEVDGERWHRDLQKETTRENIIKKTVNLLRFKALPLIKKEYQQELDNIINLVNIS